MLTRKTHSRFTLFMDLESDHDEPWYSLTKVLIQPYSWSSRTWTQSILTVHGMPARVFGTGAVESMSFTTSLVEREQRGSMTIKLLRQEDRVAAAELSDRGRWTTEQRAMAPSAPMARMSVRAVRNGHSVRATYS